MLPAAPPGRPIATYPTYAEAQAAVDFLSDEKFPVRHVSIVGTDLKMVERVTGRLTYARVALGGCLSGAYFGGFVGLILAIFDNGAGLSVLLPAILIGAAFGMIFGVISYAATGGRRDFTSTSQIVAAQYAVWCADEAAREALNVLSRMPGGRPAAPPPQTQAPTYQPGVQPPGPTYSEMLARQKAERQRAAEETGAPSAPPPSGPPVPGPPPGYQQPGQGQPYQSGPNQSGQNQHQSGPNQPYQSGQNQSGPNQPYQPGPNQPGSNQPGQGQDG